MKRLHDPVKDALAAADRHAVVDNGNSCCCGKFKAAQNFTAVEHTASAVEHKFVRCKVGGEIMTGTDGELKFAICFFFPASVGS